MSSVSCVDDIKLILYYRLAVSPGSTSWFVMLISSEELSFTVNLSKNGLTQVFGGFVAYGIVSFLLKISLAVL